MNNGTSLSLAQAATAVGMVKSSVLRAIKAGKISAARDVHNNWRIEPSELFRVFKPVAEPTGAFERPAMGDATVIAELNARASLAEQRLSDLRAMLDDLKAQRDAWQQQAEASQRQLTDQRKPESWWQWLRSTG